jgi:hypothetical protein
MKKIISLIHNLTKDFIYINFKIYKIEVNIITGSPINNKNNWKFIYRFRIFLINFTTVYYLKNIIINNIIILLLDNFVSFGNS